VFADADFAGCPLTSRSTSGMHHALLGPRSVFPIAGQSRKQGCVSHSTPEAEVVAAANALRTTGLPALHLWDALLGRAVTLEFHEDNSTAVTTMKHGYSPAMKHLERTHGVCLRWLAERFLEPQCHLFYERTALMAADIYTKAFAVPAEWDHALRLVNHIDPLRFWGGRPEGPHKANSEHMGSHHKGEVVFDYWVHNPWHGRASLDVPTPEGTSSAQPKIAAAPCGTLSTPESTDDDDDRSDGDYSDSDYASTENHADLTSDTAQKDTTTTSLRRRRIVEFCTSADSRIGRLTPPACDVIRLTLEVDLTSAAGLAKAIEAVSDPNAQVLLFGALPCTGGSAWQRYNMKRGRATQQKVQAHRDTFWILYANFVKVAAACRSNDGHIALEWPRGCSYWNEEPIKDFAREYALIDYDFDGCEYGLRSTAPATLGKPSRNHGVLHPTCRSLHHYAAPARTRTTSMQDARATTRRKPKATPTNWHCKFTGASAYALAARPQGGPRYTRHSKTTLTRSTSSSSARLITLRWILGPSRAKTACEGLGRTLISCFFAALGLHIA
jgi:hypothetical protein